MGSKYASEDCYKNKQLDAPMMEDECLLLALKWHLGKKNNNLRKNKESSHFTFFLLQFLIICLHV